MVEGERRWEQLGVTLAPDDAARVRAEAEEKRWPVTLVLRELIKDGWRFRKDREKCGER